jgi:hypothetical protein
MKYTLNEYNLEYNKLSFLRLSDTFYIWNIAESGVKHKNSNSLYVL